MAAWETVLEISGNSPNMLNIKVTLRIFSETYSLSQISSLLGKPAKGFSVGEVYGKSNKTRELTLWSIETSLPQENSLDSHINEIITFLDSRSESIEMLRHDCTLDVFCMLRTDNGQGGAVLPYPIMEKLSNYRINVVLDVYADE